MSKRIIGRGKQKELKEMDIVSFGDVKRGETELKYEVLKETTQVDGEIPYLFVNFDAVVNLGKAKIVGDDSAYMEKVELMTSFDDIEDNTVKADNVLDKNTNKETNNKDDSFSETLFAEEEPKEELPKEEPKPEIDEEKLKALLQEEHEKAFNEGYKKGMLEATENSRKAYEKEQKDYIDLLKGTYNEVISRTNVFSSAVKELDSALPEMLTHFLDSLIGAEREINSKLIVSIIKKSLSNLHELTRVVFRVNEKDIDVVNAEFPDYKSVVDSSITPGGLKIDTNIGEMDYTIETLLSNFKKLIYEELDTTQTDKH